MLKPVFISHSSLDKDTADDLCDLLEEQSIDCWIAHREIAYGNPWPEDIIRAIENASAVVLVLSVDSKASVQVQNEIAIAKEKKKRIIPVKIDKVSMTTGLDLQIAQLHRFDATESLEGCAEKIAAIFKQQHEGPVAPLRQSRQRRKAISAYRKAIVLFAAITIAGIAVISVLSILFSGRKSGQERHSLSRAYQALEQKDWSKAENLFQGLTAYGDKKIRGEGYAGFAAVAFEQGDSTAAIGFADKAEQIDPKILYSHVIRGHVLFQQDKLAEAAVEYNKAVEKETNLPWQKAIAYDRLGRINAVQGNLRQALNFYDKAIKQYQSMAVIHSNKGYVLDKLGNLKGAMAQYHQALALEPDDQITKTLLRGLQRREELARDKEKQAEIDKLVADLVQAHNTGKRPSITRDGWTSSPLTLTFPHLQSKGTIATREGETEFLLNTLLATLMADGRLAIIEREVLDKVLAELKLSLTDLVDPAGALQVGRILSARLIATGSYTRIGGQGQLSIRVTETETTRTRVTVAEIARNPQQLTAFIEKTARKLVDKLRSAYPLQARIESLTDNSVILNVGSEHGMTPGVRLHVFSSENQTSSEVEPTDIFSDPVGLIEVTDVENTRCRARILNRTGGLAAGWKAREARAF